MNIKHNKKRNTAFLYEILIREVAKAVYNKQINYKKTVMEVLTSHFTKNSVLSKDYHCYKPLYETKNMKKTIADRLVVEAKNRRDKLDKKSLFNAQTKLINDINKKLNESVWDNFVPEYRFLGTLYQYFYGDELSINTKAILEENITKRLISEIDRETDIIQPIDSITYNIFVKKFNEYYGKVLNERQKATIKSYIYSIEDGGTTFKLFLMEEIGKLKQELKTTCEGPNAVCDLEINEKIKKVEKLLETFKTKPINEEVMVPKILKIQELIEEMNSDAQS